MIARTLPDLTIALSVVASTVDSDDEKTKQVPRTPSYLNYIKNASLVNKRIGVIRGVAGKATFDPENKRSMKLFDQVMANLKNHGTILVDVTLPNFNSDRDDNMSGEVEDVNYYLASFPSTRQSYRDICLSKRTQTFGGIRGCIDHLNKTASKKSAIYKKLKFHRFSLCNQA